MSAISLPSTSGALPYWLLLVSAVSAANTVQCFLTTKFVRRVFDGPKGFQVTPLQAHTYGTWTLLSALIRFYAAYNIENPIIYQLTLSTFVLALWHHGSEWLFYGTAKLGAGLASPLAVATGSMIWMWAQWEYYVPA